MARMIALATTSVVFVLSLVLWAYFDPTTADFQFLESSAWLGGDITYKMGVDGISMLFVVLTAFLMPILHSGQREPSRRACANIWSPSWCWKR